MGHGSEEEEEEEEEEEALFNKVTFTPREAVPN
jgi:hypothetical protein